MSGKYYLKKQDKIKNTFFDIKANELQQIEKRFHKKNVQRKLKIVAKKVANEENANDIIANDVIANEEIANEEIANEEMVNDVIANDVIANEEIANEENANEELVNDGHANEENANDSDYEAFLKPEGVYFPWFYQPETPEKKSSVYDPVQNVMYTIHEEIVTFIC
jgi:hypothetical protein